MGRRSRHLSLLTEVPASGDHYTGLAPYDGQVGGGFGRLGPAQFQGRTVKSADTFPYREDGGTLEDLYPDLFDEDEDKEGDDQDIDLKTSNRLSNKLGLGYHVSDQLGQRMNVRDRSSFVGADSRLDLAHRERTVAFGMSLTLERIYTPSARSSPDAPRVSGTTRGWSAPPRGEQWDDEESIMDLDDVSTPDERAVKRAQKSVHDAQR